MTLTNDFIHRVNSRTTLWRMLLGAAIGFVIITLFVFSVDNPDPAWGPNWRIRPMIITPLATAFGMLSFYLKDLIRPQSDVMRFIVFVFSLLGFVVSLWLGSVLGLDGTLWN